MVQLAKFLKPTSLLLLSLMLWNCASYTPGHHHHPRHRHFAPVRKATRVPVGPVHSHRVHRGETLYAIAFRYSLDYRHLASINGLSAPYSLEVGQVLHIPQDSNEVVAKPFVSQEKNLSYASIHKAKPGPKKYVFAKPGRKERLSLSNTLSSFVWPTQGKIVTLFAPSMGNKGIDIAGKWRQPIVSMGPGEVVYAGRGLPDYGNLLIIKHNNDILSAYAHNDRLLVKEGQRVKAAQNIAEMGQDDRKRTVLHFEVRKNGKPVNPLEYLRQGAK